MPLHTRILIVACAYVEARVWWRYVLGKRWHLL